jgi:hypothetical protein
MDGRTDRSAQRPEGGHRQPYPDTVEKRKVLESQIPIVGYKHSAPGDMLHLDIKKLTRILKVGHRITGSSRDETWGGSSMSRLTTTPVSPARALDPDETANSSTNILAEAVTYFQRFG